MPSRLPYLLESGVAETPPRDPPEDLASHSEAHPEPATNAPPVSGCAESDVFAHTRHDDPHGGSPCYVCQATELPYATTKLEWWEISQYIEDYLSGNVGLWAVFCGAVYFLLYTLSVAGIKLGRPIRWIFDTFHPLWGGTPFPQKKGTIPDGQPTPTVALNLQPGEMVRVKSHDDILKTLNGRNRNRGLYFDAEEVPYCGGTYRVLRRVDKIINEKTRKMQEMKHPCLVLDSVVCQSRFSACRMFCPRSIYSFWHEAWLERVGPNPTAASLQEDP